MSNLCGDFINRILSLPLWVKEIVYYILMRNFKNILPCSNIDINEENLYQCLCPEITYAGKKEYERLKKEEPNSSEFKFLNALMDNLSIIEITLNNVWTLEETSQIYYNCMESQFVSYPTNPVIRAKAAYFANKIRIGEYFKRIGLIDADQLETALRIQKESETANEKKAFAAILIDMGVITRADADNVLFIKKESKRRFVLNFNTGDSSSNVPPVDNSEITQKIERLEYENKILKTKLRELLKIEKK